MDWTEIRVTVATENADCASDILQMVSNGIYIEDYSDIEQSVKEISHIDMIDDELLLKDRENVVIHAYFNAFENITEKTAYIGERLNAMSIPHEMQLTTIDDEDWANNWKQFYKPFEVGERLLIKPEWEEIPETDRLVLEIEPGLAFGTGTHESTKMCLELLEEYVTKGSETLDIGCGSGILSVAALLLGAKRAVAVDIDPLAVRAARQNGERNGFFEDKLRVVEGDLLGNIEAKRYNVVVANIVADVIIALSADLPAFIGKNGVFVCSGIIDVKLESVKRELVKNGFSVKKTILLNGWAAISAVLR